MSSLSDRHHRFWDLHQDGCFVIPNPWDAGTARLMAASGAKALATTSAGHAFTLGKVDQGHVTRDEALAHAEDIVAATPLPVSGDFENGYADEPDQVAETVRLAREAGLSGCSIEDTRMVESHPAYEFETAVARIEAAAQAARSLDDPFVLCARADGVMNGTYDMDEAISRVVAFDEAGADLIYVPVVPDVAALGRVIDSISKPVNALAAGALTGLSVGQFAALGVRRISVGSLIARMAHAATDRAMQAIIGEGSFGVFSEAADGGRIDRMLVEGSGG